MVAGLVLAVGVLVEVGYLSYDHGRTVEQVAKLTTPIEKLLCH